MYEAKCESPHYEVSSRPPPSTTTRAVCIYPTSPYFSQCRRSKKLGIKYKRPDKNNFIVWTQIPIHVFTNPVYVNSPYWLSVKPASKSPFLKVFFIYHVKQQILNKRKNDDKWKQSRILNLIFIRFMLSLLINHIWLWICIYNERLNLWSFWVILLWTFKTAASLIICIITLMFTDICSV